MGEDYYVRNVAGKHKTHERTNENGERLCNLATLCNLRVVTTDFKLRPNKETWMRPTSDEKSN